MKTFSCKRTLALSVLSALLTGALASAQTPWQTAIGPSARATRLPYDRGSVALWQSLLKLRTRASLLMIVAHPDDEDAGMLTYESRGQGARVVMLTLNRGEGGQNVMSSAYWDALGILRTQELLAADRYHGVQQYFTDVVDFGFSKSKEESFAKWGHQRLLGEVVRIVRLTRPLVITSVWVGGPSDGHGQHAVAGELAQEAFKAAGDPNAFPEQIRAGLRPWQPLKMYARVPSFSISNGKMYDYATRTWSPAGVYDYIHQRWMPGVPATNLTIPEGDYNAILGLSFARLAAEGLGEQKSQNGGVGYTPPGPRLARYHRYASKVAAGAHESSFFDGIDTSISGIARLANGGNAGFLHAGLARIQNLADEASRNFRADDPEAIAGTLAEGLKATDDLLAQVNASRLSDDAKYDVAFEIRVKQAEFNNAILEAFGVTMQALVVPAEAKTKSNPFGPRVSVTSPNAIPGETLHVQVKLDNPSRVALRIRNVDLSNSAGAQWNVRTLRRAAGALESNQPAAALFSVTVPGGAAYTKPYFSRPNIEQPYYNILAPQYAGLPFAPFPLAVRAELLYENVPVQLEKVVQTAQRVRGEGTVLQPLVVSPAISVWLSPHAGIVPLDTGATPITVTVHSDVQGPAKGTVRLQLPAGWSASPAVAHFTAAGEGQNEVLHFELHAANLREQSYQVSAAAEYGGHSYGQGFETIGYLGLPPYNYYRPAECRLTGADIKVPSGLEVGYIEGTGDRVPQALESLGIAVHTITAQELATGKLAGYSAIVLGVRAYAAREDVRTYNARLLQYVENGGVVIVQYNTPEFDHDYGPYPYSLSSNPEVVVDENSPVSILAPSNPALRWPNKITTKDFSGWVEERGHGFMKTWDPRYQALIETHDPGQPPQKGGLLYARYGKGVYIYDALAFYRQLPEGVPGAYRIFANLVSLAKNPEH